MQNKIAKILVQIILGSVVGGVYRILRKNEEKVALFCHYAFAKSWLSTLLHIPIHLMWGGFDFSHTAVTVVEFANNENGFTAPRVLCFGDVSHLYKENLDLIINNRTESFYIIVNICYIFIAFMIRSI